MVYERCFLKYLSYWCNPENALTSIQQYLIFKFTMLPIHILQLANLRERENLRSKEWQCIKRMFTTGNMHTLKEI